MSQVKRYAVQIEYCQDGIKLDQRQIERDLLQMKRESGQIKREEQQIEREEEQIERVFPCLVFSRSALFLHPVYMECRESGFAAPRCLLTCNNK